MLFPLQVLHFLFVHAFFAVPTFVSDFDGAWLASLVLLEVRISSRLPPSAAFYRLLPPSTAFCRLLPPTTAHYRPLTTPTDP